MNLPKIREEVHSDKITEFIDKNRLKIILPDQDVLNGLYGEKIKPLPDKKYNYDTRKNYSYFIKNPQAWNVDWVFKNTIILHFCGKNKPWNSKSLNPYHFLYKHYENKFNKLIKKNKSIDSMDLFFSN